MTYDISGLKVAKNNDHIDGSIDISMILTKSTDTITIHPLYIHYLLVKVYSTMENQHF